ncbi:MAG TPA: DUF2490 domain-containing protein [Pyrinomonadaceae bacterium]|nr:DUF2490 domain-containing protein [Pyrinomonadaceae bacterium]
MRPLLGRIALLIFILLIISAPAFAQDDDPVITNEYRFTNITAKPVTDKMVLFTYSGITESPEKHFRSYYTSPPNIIYQAKPWLEFLLGGVVVYTDNRRANDSWEVRPVTGVKFSIPNNKKWFLFSLSRFEYRMITQDDEMQKIPRFRNRFGLEAPLAKTEKAWNPKTWYFVADVEPIFRLDQKRLQVVRLRGGPGYVVNKNLRVELLYHYELSGTPTDPFDHTQNIFRLNFKVSLPRKGWRYPASADVD